MKRVLTIITTFVFFLILAGCTETAVVEFDVNFDSNGGTPVGTVTTEGNTITLPANPTKEGYEFDGWYWDNDTFNDPFTVASLQEQPLSSDITLYAKWSELSASTSLTDQLMFIYNLSQEAEAFDGTYEEWLETVRGPQGLPGEDGREITLQLDGGFIQWKYVGDDSWTNLFSLDSITGPSGKSAYDIYVEHYPEYDGDEETWINALVNGTLQNTTELTVTFNYNDDVTEPTITTVDYLGKINEPEEPTRDGYTFTGWTYMDEQWSFIGFIVTDNMILEANWEETEYSLQFLTKGGDVYKEDTFIFGEDLSEVTYPVIEISGYTLLGWNQEIPATMPANDVVIQSLWEENIYGDVNVLDEVPTDPITVTFWHVFGDTKGALLQDYITEFEAMYPNITIDATAQGAYDDLEHKAILSINAGVPPTMILGYSNNIMKYLQGNAVIPLDGFIEHETHGVDINDFVESYVRENRQYNDGLMYSMPYSKSTNILIYNKTLFELNGITVPEDGTITWDMLDTWANTMVGTGENQCEYLINYDSASDLFVNSTRMWDGLFLDTDGNVAIGDQNTLNMINYVKDRFDNNTFALPIAWNQVYGSNNFLNQDVCMTVGSSVSVRYNIPDEGSFEIGVAPIPQYDLDNKSATQQGPNVAIMSNTTDEEQLAAWLFIKHMTNAENSARWSMLTGYQPVRYSSYETDLYQTYLNDPDPDYIYKSMAANAAYKEIDYLNFYPAYVGAYSSLDVYNYTEIVMQAIYSGQPITDVLNNMLEHFDIEGNTNPDDGGPAIIISSGKFVDSNITLPTTILGSDISWSSSHPDILSASGTVNRPSFEIGDIEVTLTATFTYEETEYIRVFTFIVLSESDPTFDTIAQLHMEAEYGSEVSFQGIVSYTFNGGYFLTDGINYIGIYNKYVDGKLVPDVGDEILVKGEYTNYHSIYQISDPTMEDIISTGNTLTMPEPSATIGEILALDSTDKLIHGKRYTVTGILEERADGSYTDLYLVDADGELLIYYDSLTSAYNLLKTYVGKEVTIKVQYYTDHFTDGILVLFSDDASGIHVAGDNLINVGDFDTTSDLDTYGKYEYSGSATLTIENEMLKVSVVSSTTAFDPRIDLMGIPFKQGKTYRVTFDAKATTPKNIQIKVGELLSTAPWFTEFMGTPQVISLGTEMTTYSFEFTMDLEDNANGGLTFEFGSIGDTINIDTDIYFDNIIVAEVVPLTVSDALLEEDGTSVLVEGVVSGFYYDQFFIQDEDGTAIYVDVDLEGAVVLGDSVILSGTKLGYDNFQDGNTQPYLDDVTLVEVVISDNNVFVKTNITPAELAANFGDYYSQRLSMDLTVQELDDGFGYIHFVGADGVSIKISNNYAEYFEYLYAVDDVVSVTFNVYKLDYDNVKAAAVTFPELTDTQKLDIVEGMLTEDGTTLTLSEDIELAIDHFVADYGVTVSWISSDEAIITTDGTVTQPAIGETDATVTLTATLTIGTSTREVVFTVTVPALQEPITYDYTETFTNLVISEAYYGDGTFTGDNSVTWTYTESGDHFVLDGTAIMLDKDGDGASLSATITGGIGALSVEYYDAFSGPAQVVIIINEGETSEVTFTSSAVDYDVNDETGEIALFEVADINIEGEFTITIYSGESQMVIDNLQWTMYSGS